jgi:mono/diheme cytochrome c family protein
MSASRTAFALSLLFAGVGALLACDNEAGPRSGERLWNELGCVNCHGPDGSGMPGFAPTLHGKKSFWTREKLEIYLRDPVGYAQKDPRLKQQKVGFISPMPPVTSPDPGELTRIADYVLALP